MNCSEWPSRIVVGGRVRLLPSRRPREQQARQEPRPPVFQTASETPLPCVYALLLTLGLAAGLSPAAGPQRLTTDGKLKSAPVFASSQEIVFAVHEAPNLVAL